MSAQRSSPVLAWAVLLAGLPLVTGAYALLPGSGFALLGIIVGATLADDAFWSRVGGSIEAPMLAPAGLLLLVLGFDLALRGGTTRAALEVVFALLLLVAMFRAFASLRDEPGRGPEWAIDLYALAMVLILSLGQYLEVSGQIDLSEQIAADPERAVLFRPGGFLNPNMTSAVALVAAWLVAPHQRQRTSAPALVTLVLALAIVAVSQSRAGLAASFVLLAITAVRRPRAMLAIAPLVVLPIAWYIATTEDDLVTDLVLRFVERLGGDSSSDERAWLLANARQMIGAAPWLGHGHDALRSRYESGSHNQAIELVVNHGLPLAAAIVAALVVALRRCSLGFVLVVVAPTFLFSHNFFDSASFQAALGLAWASERRPHAQRRSGAWVGARA